MPPVQVRAPGMGCVRSRRTWRRAFTTDMGARRREKQHFSRVVGPLWGLAVCTPLVYLSGPFGQVSSVSRGVFTVLYLNI